MEVADPEAIHIARMRLIRALAKRNRTQFEDAFRRFSVPGPYSPGRATCRYGATMTCPFG